MEHEQSTEHSSMHCGSESEVLGFLSEEQKRKVAVMKMDMKIQWMEMKISDMGKMIELKKKAIADIKQVQEMIKPKK
jgi:ABC-type hemin transport system substrate-binding protein